ncbi:MAG: glutamate racemase [Oscillospiraceae bacterium]|jgi:glutamate racemase|nr:glutamate racemase [Oscillospiraceae bacterium]
MNRAIGVFDSGLGGLTTVKALNELLPNEDIIYFGDTARIPYGNKSRETVIKYAVQDTNFLKSKNVKMIIAACGTVSSLIGGKPLASDIPFTGVLLPAVQAACAATRTKRIGVIGTPSTIKSGSYGKAVKNIEQKAFIIGKECPMFVPLVENGYTSGKIAEYFVKEYLEPIKKENVDTLILGCTHYPILKDIIGEYMGEDVKLISPGEEAAKYASIALLSENLLNPEEKEGKNFYYVSDSPEDFEQNAVQFLGGHINGTVELANVS